MKNLTQTQIRTTNILRDLLQSRLDEQFTFVNKIQEDPETGSSLCEIQFISKKALAWIRKNGSASAINGTRILLAGGKTPNNKPLLSSFVTNLTPQ